MQHGKISTDKKWCELFVKKKKKLWISQGAILLKRVKNSPKFIFVKMCSIPPEARFSKKIVANSIRSHTVKKC